MSSACIVIPYFGTWPTYFRTFLKTFEYNTDFSILFFTDLEPPVNAPANVNFYKISLAEIRYRLDAIVGFETAINSPYKLCDVRPAYGLIFDEYLTGFDFWGWGDIDVIYGDGSHSDISSCFKQFDIVSFRERWLSGSLCFIRNNTFCKNLFLRTNELKRILSSEEYMGFDEISRCWDQIRVKNFWDISFPCENFTMIVRKAAEAGELSLYSKNLLKESIGNGEYLRWTNGILDDNNGTTYLLYHFITEKRKLYFTYPSWVNPPAEFFIDQTGFFTPKQFERRKVVGAFRVLSSQPMMFAQRVVNIISKVMTRFVG